MTAPPGLPLAPPAHPGVTRFDVLCGPRAVETVLRLLGTWADDRALAQHARTRLTHVMDAALDHGLRFEPRAVTISVRWVDVERVRVDLRWFGGAEAARRQRAGRDLSTTIATLEALTVEWGVGRRAGVAVQWVVADVS